MNVKFDKFGKYETPSMILCNPGSVQKSDLSLTNVVCGITNTSDEELVESFNSPSELNFRVYMGSYNDNDERIYFREMFDAISTRRLVFLGGIGYFMISDVSYGYDEFEYKDVQAKSVEVELEQKMIPFVADGTYQFYTDPDSTESESGLLNMIVDSLFNWSIGHVDGFGPFGGDSDLPTRFRTFENIPTDTNCLSFMMEQMQDLYDCIFEFDRTTREINAYDKETYLRDTDIHISNDDIIKNLTVRENNENVYTALTVRGGDGNVLISPLNPTGTNTIYDFSNYYRWMSDGLAAKVRTWSAKVESYRDTYKSLNYTKLTTSSALYDAEADFATNRILLEMYSKCADNIVAEGGSANVKKYNDAIVENGGTPIDISDDIASMIGQIAALFLDTAREGNEIFSRLVELRQSAISLDEQINEIIEDVSFYNVDNFPHYMLNELDAFMFEGEYTDEDVIFTNIMDVDQKFDQMSILYDRAKNRLSKLSRPVLEYDVDVENFLFNKEFSEWAGQIRVGCIVNVERSGIGVFNNSVDELFLSGITLNYSDKTLKLTFGGRLDRNDQKSLFDNLTNGVTKTANTVNFVKKAIEPLINGDYEAVREAANNGKNIVMGKPFSTDDGSIIIDASGYTSRDVDSQIEGEPVIYSNEQLKITGKKIALTDDSWSTSKDAIGIIPTSPSSGVASEAYGINGEAVVGNLVIGDKLNIKASGGSKILYKDDDRICSNIGNNRVVDIGSTDVHFYTPIKVGNTTLTEQQLIKLLALIS